MHNVAEIPNPEILPLEKTTLVLTEKRCTSDP